MEKVLKLYKYIDGSNDTPFPNVEYQAVVSDFRYDVKRMGGAPIVTCTVMHTLCLDKLWSDNVYAYFNGEKFFIKQIPTSSYSNTDSRYKHELELVSERFVLDNVYFYDVVDSSENNDKPVSNSSKFSFFGDIREFASRLNQSLQYSKVGYSVVVDDGISSESKMVSFQDQFFSNAIQESYNTYNIPYYFVGKVIHFGYTNNAITHTLKYGQDESLLSIQKQNSNYKIVNRVTGVGSSDNIPYYYPNDYESKEEVEANGGVWINPQTNLMPSIYRETLGDERFYKALNGTYQIPNSNEYYEFANLYIEGKPKEHIVNFEDVKPTIKGMVNSNGMRIDMFQEFAYDLNDNDETDEEGNYLHPYFFAKLRNFDGEHGFNLFDHAIDEQEMTISMTSGNCGACEFVIGVDESTQKNTVQVADNGSLERDDDGNVKFGTPQDKQNDTINNEVWIALRKDIDTFGVIMPNATNNYKPSVNDTFVILHIDLPKAYILAAEDNLKNQLIEYMALNNSEKFNFSISFSRIFFAEHPDILEQLNENARIQIEYDNTNYELYISSYSYSMSSDKPLPEIRVELSDTLTISQNALQTAINEVKSEILQSGVGVSGGDILKRGLKYFLRKDTDDRSKGKISTDKALEVGRFVQGASGAIIQVDANTGQTTAELDKLYVRMKAYFETLEIINTNSMGGKLILSPSGSIRCNNVEEYEDYYRCYFLNEQDGEKVENRFKVSDQAFSQMFNAKEGVSNNISNHYYWRLVVGVGENYIDLSKSDADEGSDVPKIGDVINHRGNRNEIDRQNFIEFSSVGTNSPYITLFQGVNSYSLTNKEYVSFGYDQSTGRAYMNVYGDMFFGNRDESSYIKYNPTEGLVVKGKLSVGSTYNGSEIGALFDKQQEDLKKFTEAVSKEFENIRNEMDGAIDTWFGDGQPTLDNYPASDWTTDEMKDSHLGDLFYANDGKAYRFQYTDSNGYYWATIEDSEVVKALELAQKALDTADGKRRVFIEQPYPPYDLGDLWAAGESQPLKRCINARESGSYYKSDWAFADDSHAYTDAVKKEIEDSINATKSELDKAIEDAEAAAKNYTDEGKEMLQQSIDQLNEAKANVNDVYTKAQADDEITKAENDAITAAKAQADAAIKLSEETIKAYADREITKEEEARIKQAAENLAAAKQYAEAKANEAFNNAMEEIAGYEYLKQALKEDTTIEGGLIQSSLLKLGYTDINDVYHTMSGTNGIYDSSLLGGGIATWWGGEMYDLANYYDWDGDKWTPKSGITIPTTIPSGLIRFDGTGYFAKGNFWWDENGEIHADPTALLLSFDTDTGDETLASTIINLRKTMELFASMWVKKEDNSGNEYLYTSLPIATLGGITMYGGDSIDAPTIMDAIAVDGTTISKSGGVLKVIGGTGGGVADSVAWANITGKPTWIGSSKPTYSYSEITGAISTTELQNYLTSNSYLNVTSGDNRYLKLSGGTVSGQLTVDGYYFKAKEISGIALELSNAQPYIDFHFNNDTGDFTTRLIEDLKGQLTILGRLVVSNGLDVHNTLRVYDATIAKWYNVLHEGNYSSYALPLSGGTLTGNILLGGTTTNKIGTNIVDTSGGFQEFTHQNSNGYIALGPFNGSVAHIYTDRPSFYFNKDLYVNSAKVWHAGNDGSGSSLDADLLDNHHEEDFVRGFVNNVANLDTPFTTNRPYIWRYGSGNSNIPSGASYYSNILHVGVNGGDTAFDLLGSYSNNKLLFRVGTWYADGSGTIFTNDWKEIAFTDSNVASATKMQTARTIWGQSFDGTSNIHGSMTGLNYILGFSAIRNSSNVNESNGIWVGSSMSSVLVNTDLAYYATKHIFLVGNVGIGTTNPSYKLHVAGSGYFESNLSIGTASLASLAMNRTSANYIITPSGGYMVFCMGGNATSVVSSNLVLYTHNVAMAMSGGNVGIGTTNPSTKLHVSGDILATGGITMYSMRALKNVVDERGLSLNELSTIKPTRYTWKDGRDNRLHFGGIADDIQQVLPEVVYSTSDGILTMDYGNAAFAVASSLIHPVIDHEKRIAMLQKRIVELEEEVERLKAS